MVSVIHIFTLPTAGKTKKLGGGAKMPLIHISTLLVAGEKIFEVPVIHISTLPAAGKKILLETAVIQIS
jgi:hypothetical protein